MRNEFDLRDAVFHTLTQSYAPSLNNVGWYQAKHRSQKPESPGGYVADICLQLTTDILALYAFAHSQDRNEDLFNRVHNMIWYNFPGGGVAERAARRVAEVLNIEVPDDY